MRHLLLLYIVILSPSAMDARGVHTSMIVIDETPSPIGRQAMTSLVVRMPVEDGPSRGGRKDVES